MSNELKIGDVVEKVSGYRYPGVVVAKFAKLDGKTLRYVVECTAPECEGILHIFNENQLRIIDSK